MSVRMRTPFAMIPEWVVKADISAHAVRLYAALMRYDGLPEGAHPSRETLAHEWLHVSLNTVDRAKAELITIGALTVEERRGQTNQYWLEDRPTLPTGEEGTLIIGEEGTLPTGGERKRDSKRELIKRETSSAVPAQARAEIWDALSQATGIAPVSHGEKTRFGMSTRDLVDLGATAEEVVTRARHFVERYPGATLTDRALVNRWGELSNGATKRHRRKYGTGVTPGEIGDMVKQLKEQGR